MTRTILVAMAFAGACGVAPMGPVGFSSSRPPPPPDSATADAGMRGPSPVPADFREHMARVVDRQLSRGHGEKYDAVVWVDATARAGWDAGGDLADGATLVEELSQRADGAGKPAGLLLMEKRAGAWSFTAIGPDGEVADDAKTAACKTCHDAAPRDDVFRVAVAPVPSPLSSSVRTQSTMATTSAATTASAPTAVATTAATHEARSAGSAASP
jgi:hypothetical protein